MHSTLRNIKNNVIIQILRQSTLHNYIATAYKTQSSPEMGTQRNQATTSLKKQLSREFLTFTYLSVQFQDFRMSPHFSYRKKQRCSFKVYPLKTKSPLLVPVGLANTLDFPHHFLP